MDRKQLFVLISILLAFGVAVGMIYDSWKFTPSRQNEANLETSTWRFEFDSTNTSYYLVLGPGKGVVSVPVANP
jgi:hypothetical protein